MYSQQVEEQISMINSGKNSTNDIQSTVQQLNNIVVKSAIKAAPEKKIRRHRKANLAVYSPIIKSAIQNKKKAFRGWKDGGRPQESSHTLLVIKKNDDKTTQKSLPNRKCPELP